jgi:GntR family transcriptional repressor for pyruvate dehydrogenase complex
VTGERDVATTPGDGTADDGFGGGGDSDATASLSGVFAGMFSGAGQAARPAVMKPLTMASAGERIADRLVTAIALGNFVPGQRLPSERDMAAMLEVSRASVREAVQRLAAEGYVEVRRGRSGGAYVATDWLPASAEKVRRTLLPSWHALENLLDCRSCVEEMIATVAARRRTDDDVEAISTALASYQEAGDDRELSRAADAALHGAVARATQSPYLVQLSDHLGQAVGLGFRAEPYTVALRNTALEQHGQLARAVIAGEPPLAGEVAARHFTLTEDHIRGLVARIRDEPTADRPPAESSSHEAVPPETAPREPRPHGLALGETASDEPPSDEPSAGGASRHATPT